MVQPPWETVWRLLEKLQTELPYDPAIPTSGYVPERAESSVSKTYLHTHVHYSMIHKSQAAEATRMTIYKLWCTHTLEYYSALIKKAE